MICILLRIQGPLVKFATDYFDVKSLKVQTRLRKFLKCRALYTLLTSGATKSLCIHMYVCIHTYVYIFFFTYICIHLYVYICMFVCIFMYTSLCIYICMFLYIYVYIFMYIYDFNVSIFKLTFWKFKHDCENFWNAGVYIHCWPVAPPNYWNFLIFMWKVIWATQTKYHSIRSIFCFVFLWAFKSL